MKKGVPMRKENRYLYLDSLRGLTLLSMILYHTIWDLVYIAGVKLDWFRTDAAYIWQQSICWTFILLAGFCWSLGRRKLKRGCVVFAAGALIMLVTGIFLPAQRIIFGVLTLLGSCMLLMIPLEKVMRRIPETVGFPLSVFLFLLTKDINSGYLGFGSLKLVSLPKAWYDGGYVMTFLGFMDKDFYSTDYFSLFPWIFLFLAGYFLYRIAKRGALDWAGFNRLGNKPLAYLGRHSLLIYMLHQPIIYFAITCCFA